MGGATNREVVTYLRIYVCEKEALVDMSFAIPLFNYTRQKEIRMENAGGKMPIRSMS